MAKSSKEIGKEVIEAGIRMAEEAHRSYGFTEKKIANERALVAFSDPADLFDIAEGGELRLKTFEEMGDKRRAIKKIREKTTIKESSDGKLLTKYSTVEIELHDKIAALNRGELQGGQERPAKMDVNHGMNESLMAMAVQVLGNKRGK